MSRKQTVTEKLPNLISKTFRAAMGERREWFILFLAILTAGIFNSFVLREASLFVVFNAAIVLAAFLAGKRHGVTPALLLFLVVVLVAFYEPRLFSFFGQQWSLAHRLASLAAWGGFLLLTASLLFTLHERKESSKAKGAVLGLPRAPRTCALFLTTVTRVDLFMKRLGARRYTQQGPR